MRAEKVGRDTLLSQIVQMVAAAQRSRAPIQRLADRVSSWFVPLVIAIAILAFAAWAIFGPEPRFAYGLVAAVTVLIIACPCALGLATPMSIMVGVGRGAEAGVLIKNAEALERMEKVDTLLVDKTGTLTEGKPRVTKIIAASGFSEDELLALAASLESASEHPLADAIVCRCEREKTFLVSRGKFRRAGRQRRHRHGGWPQGRHRQCGLPAGAKCRDERPRIRRGRIAPRRRHRDLRRRRRQARGRHRHRRSGEKHDRGRALSTPRGRDLHRHAHRRQPHHRARHCAKTRHWRSRGGSLAGPKERRGRGEAPGRPRGRHGRRRRQRRPALAAADVGIAMGTGTDVAIESAGITLLRGDLTGIVRARRLSQATMRNIRQNLFFAFVYNALGVPVAAGVLYPFFGILLSPIVGAAAMAASSVSVIGNALRLRHTKL